MSTKTERTEDIHLLFPLSQLFVFQNKPTAAEMIADVIKIPDITAPEMISHLLDAIKRFIYNLLIPRRAKNKTIYMCRINYKDLAAYGIIT